MKILLVIPRYNLTNKVSYRYNFPLGLAYISAILKKHNYDVDCLNLNHLNGKIEILITKQLDKKKYDLVCSGHFGGGVGYIIMEKIVKTARKHQSNPKTILGGTLITSEPKLMLKYLKPDFIVIGEGERTIIELIKEIQKNEPNFSKINGIGYKNKYGRLTLTKSRKVVKNINFLPLPDFEGLGFNKLVENTSGRDMHGFVSHPRVYPILASRGCPFQCTFCYHSIGPKYRERLIDNVVEELKIAIPKYKINSVIIYDDLFSINKKRLYEFCKKIKELFKKIPWECKWICQLSVLNISKKILKTLKNSGCCMISFGFESYSSKILKSMRKPITPKQIDNAIKLSREVGMAFQGNFIFGDIAETKETAFETLNYWKKNTRGEILLNFIQPYPKSAIYKHCIKKGIIKDKLDFIKNKMNHTNWINMTDNMTDKEILQLKKEILNARVKYANYLIPKLKKRSKKKWDAIVKCPYCKSTLNYENSFIANKFYYEMRQVCGKCNARFSIVSPLFKFTTNHYQKLDFLRRKYLLIQDKILKKRL